MAHPARDDKQYKMAFQIKEFVTDIKQTLKELSPAFKALRAEWRETERDLKQNVAEIKAVVKDAAQEIKAAFKSGQPGQKDSIETPHETAMSEDQALQELHTTQEEPVRIVCDRGRWLGHEPEPEADTLDVTLVGVSTFDIVDAPVLA